MNWYEENLNLILEEVFQELEEALGAPLSEAIRSVIWTNLTRGRVLSFLEGNEHATPRQYVLRVIEFYNRLHPHLYNLQVVRASEAWQTLYDQMCQTAQHYFVRWDVPNIHATHELAKECASEAAARILTAHFPYDVEFDPWMYVLLRNVCYSKLKKSVESAAQDLSALEECLTDSSIPTGRKIETQIDLRNGLLSGLEQLTPARRQVVWMHYFENRTFQEIADEMGKSVNAIHQLHFYALHELEKILNKNDP